MTLHAEAPNCVPDSASECRSTWNQSHLGGAVQTDVHYEESEDRSKGSTKCGGGDARVEESACRSACAA